MPSALMANHKQGKVCWSGSLASLDAAARHSRGSHVFSSSERWSYAHQSKRGIKMCMYFSLCSEFEEQDFVAGSLVWLE